MYRFYHVLSSTFVVTLSACTFDATGLTEPVGSTDTGDDSGSSAPLPTTGADTPTTTVDAPTPASTTTGVASSDPATTGGAPMTASGETTGPTPAVCGDGVVEADEECDDGAAGNADDNMCTSICIFARCGDGHVQPANGEACDAGDLNVEDPGYGQCSLSCAKGPYCGDGEVQVDDGEQCEPTETDGEQDTCTATCVREARVVFVTSLTTSGALGGVAGADKFCKKFATNAMLPGTYRAWLLVDGSSLAERFPEYVGMQPPLNFVNTAGDLLATSFSGLVLGGPMSAIVYTGNGQPMPEKYVWTNITSSGFAAGGDCSQWTSTAGVARVGFTGFIPDQGPAAQTWHENRNWTDMSVDIECGDPTLRLYCIQVAG